jgi:hypothetical protein
MRKHLLFVLLATLCCTGLFAQEGDDRPYRIAIGPKVGVGLDMASHSNLQNLDFGMGFGYQFGAVFNAHFGRRYEMSEGGTGMFGLQLEAMYDGRAVKLGSTKVGIGCIEVPVVAQFYIIPNLALEAGVTIVKVLSCSPNELNHEGVTYGTGGIKGGDMMISAGLAYKARLNSSSSLMLDARYNLGMSPLAGNFDTKVSSVMLSVAYLFNIVK